MDNCNYLLLPSDNLIDGRIVSVKIEDHLPKDAHFIDITMKFIYRSSRNKRTVDKYEIYSGNVLIMTLFVKPSKEE